MQCKEAIKSKGGRVSVDELVAEMTPLARTSVPESVRSEVLERVKEIVDHQQHQ